jgi:proton-coupled amino acid transporter
MSSPAPISVQSELRRKSSNVTGPSSSPFKQASLRLGSPVTTGGVYSPQRRDLDDHPSFVSGTDTPASIQSGFDDTVFADRISLSMHRHSSGSGAGGLSRAILAASFGTTGGGGGGDGSATSESSMDIDNPDPEVVKVVGRHLVKEPVVEGSPSYGATDIDDKFMSLRLQGGDITRQLYNWQREHEEGEASTKRGRSRSFDLPRPVVTGPNGQPIDAKNIKAPGGFRRNFIVHKSHQNGDLESNGGSPHHAFLTRNFIEFLSIYGHFAGEELEEEEDEEEYESGEEEISGQEPTEETALMPKLHRRRSARSTLHGPGNASATKAVMLLLKSFVGTGVLFLPRAYSNGGILFSSVLLVFVSILSYWCFLLLIESKDAVGVASFGDVGGELYGPRMRKLILFSIVLSQIGFAAAYIVFVSENMQAFVLAVTKGQTLLEVEYLIFLQLLIFLPLSMVRDLAKLSGTALIADFFILLGLVYLYYWGALTIFEDGVADIKLFNSKSWTLFIGTAIFTYEGIGLIIPIQESMKRPHQFRPVLAGVMVGITLVFVSIGALLYSAYGSSVETVIILNLPQDSKLVNAIQLLYSVAIMLSTPLQLFPAIRIMEHWLFVRSGKYNTRIKWEKNVFRFCLTIFTAFVAWGGADDLDKFVALIGSFACIPLVYIYPPLLHIKAVNQRPILQLADIVLCIFGVGVMAYTTHSTVTSWIRT